MSKIDSRSCTVIDQSIYDTIDMQEEPLNCDQLIYADYLAGLLNDDIPAALVSLPIRKTNIIKKDDRRFW